MKTCVKCTQLKALTDFHKKSNALDGLQSWCKECNKQARKKSYARPGGREVVKVWNKERSRLWRELVIDYLLCHPCVDCGENDLIVLDFDHREPSQKSFSIGREGSRKSLVLVQVEIDKCDVRCANCHRRRTAKQFGWFKHARLAENMPN